MLALENYTFALESYDQALKLDPQNVRALVGRGDALRRMGQQEPALESYNSALELDPGNIRALEGKGDVLFKQGDLRGALAAYDRVVDLAPDKAQTRQARTGQER